MKYMLCAYVLYIFMLKSFVYLCMLCEGVHCLCSGMLYTCAVCVCFVVAFFFLSEYSVLWGNAWRWDRG